MRTITYHIKKKLYLFIFILVIGISCFTFISTTTPGLYCLLQISKLFIPGTLEISGLTGSLSRGFHFDEMNYDDQSTLVSAKDAHFNWQFKLGHQLWLIDSFFIKDVHVQRSDADKPSPSSFHLPALPLQLHINNLNIDSFTIQTSSFAQTLTKIHMQASFLANSWEIQSLSTEINSAKLNLQASLQPYSPYQLSSHLSLASANNAFPFTGEWQMEGEQSRYALSGKISGASSLTMQGFLQDLKHLSLHANWKKFYWPSTSPSTFSLGQGQLNLEGNLPQLQLSLDSKLNTPVVAQAQASMQYDGQKMNSDLRIQGNGGKLHFSLKYDALHHPFWQGVIQAHFLNENKIDLFQEAHLTGQFSFDDFVHGRLNCKLDGHYHGQSFNGEITYAEQKWTSLLNLAHNQIYLNGASTGPWKLQGVFDEPHLLHPLLNDLRSTVEIKGTIENPQQGFVDVVVRKGTFMLTKNEGLAFIGGKSQFILNKEELNTKGEFILDRFKKLKFALSFPQFQLGAWNGAQKIKGKAELNINSLDFLEKLSPDLSQVQGAINAALSVQGTIKKPQMTGKIELKNGSLTSAQNGLLLHPIQFNLTTKNNQWQGEGQIVSAGKALNLRGKGKFYPKFLGQIQLDGEQILLVSSPQYIIYVSPHLTIDVNAEHPQLTGKIIIPKALLKPQSFTNTVTLSNDAVFTNTVVKNNNPYHLDTHLSLAMGDEVSLAVKGLQGFLRGSIDLRQLPDGPLNATGELTIAEGKYKAYGQDLKIEQGQLLFSGGLLENPGINLRAVRTFDNTNTNFTGSDQLFDFDPSNMQTLDFGSQLTVGIQVTGRLLAPKIQLFSNPSNLSQADILSMLLLGRPANQASKSGGQLLLAAISSMNLDSGSSGLQLMNQIKQNLGLDLNIANNSTYDKKTNQVTDSTSLVVGKSLSKRLYLSYNVGLSQADNNVLTLKYLLNKFFSIQVDASPNGSGVDLLYTHQKE